MKERPILFSAPMVRALLEGRKTQTRRIIKPQPVENEGMGCRRLTYFTKNGRESLNESYDPWPEHALALSSCPYGEPGDRLWVREGWWKIPEPSLGQRRAGADTWPKVAYLADEPLAIYEEYKEWGWKAKPSIHMPHWASRISLEVSEVRVQRLLEVTESDAKAEGATPWEFGPEQTLTTGERGADSPYRSGFAYLWDCINADRATWKSNPWVWAVTFKGVA